MFKKEKAKAVKNNALEGWEAIGLTEILDTNDYSRIKNKKSLPIEEKLTLIRLLVDAVASIDENDLIVIDYGLKHFMLRLSLVENYTNISLSGYPRIDAYNLMEDCGIIKLVLDGIDRGDFDLIEEILNKELQQKQELYNSLSGIASRSLSRLVAKIPTGEEFEEIVEKTKEQVNSLDQNNLKFIQDAVKVLGQARGNSLKG